MKNVGSGNDIDVSKLSVSRAGDRSYSLTSPDIELSSDTTFSLNLNDADQLKLSRLLNKNGTYSRAGTLYSFAAAEDWLQEQQHRLISLMRVVIHLRFRMLLQFLQVDSMRRKSMRAAVLGRLCIMPTQLTILPSLIVFRRMTEMRLRLKSMLRKR